MPNREESELDADAVVALLVSIYWVVDGMFYWVVNGMRGGEIRGCPV